ncbi:hypothetical protein [Azospirillum agricola]|uniref:hypothetical protein n=1 Tax=Azospirillum agricola TaxID=1720247 RepID=UPI000A0EFA44|nr:hypothetical protein [Azospirillum agricola]SMH62972.1 hypothetical protein SAMN02982994_6798 [Azospirillum lipoferum]
MAKPLDGVGGAGTERGITSADVIAEARQRQMDRLKAAQAANDKPAEVVEGADKGQQAGIPPRNPPRDDIQPYRVQLDPETQRLHTEVLDTETGRVIMRIPPTYVEPDLHAEEASAGEDGETPEREVKA